MLSKVKHYRSSHGFGIHSPFAYDFVTNTLRCRLPYYSYEEIERMAPGNGYQLRLLLRVLCALKPSKVAFDSSLDEKAAHVATIALGNKVLNNGDEADFLFTDHTGDLSALGAILDRGGSLMICHGKEALETVMPLYDRGMSFSNGRISIIVGRPDLPRQHFNINF